MTFRKTFGEHKIVAAKKNKNREPRFLRALGNLGKWVRAFGLFRGAKGDAKILGVFSAKNRKFGGVFGAK